MGHLSTNPLHDAIDHINAQDRASSYDFDFTCDFCGDGFDKGHGVKITDEKFCNKCMEEHRHFAHYQRCGASDRTIIELDKYHVVKL